MQIPFAWRGWPFGANLIRFGEGDPLDANPIRFGEGDPLGANPILLERVTQLMRIPFAVDKGNPLKRIPFAVEREPPWGEYHSLWRRGLPWSESHSLWRGEVPWGEYHSLGEGNPLDRGGPPGGESHSLGGDCPEAKPIRCGEGSPLRWMSFTWSTLRRGPPGQGGFLYEVNPIRIGDGDPMVQSPVLGIWCCKGDILDANRIWVAKVIPVKIPVFRRRESPLTGSSTVARRVASYESIRSVRANGNCDEDDRWSRSLNTNGLEGDRGLDARRGPWSDDECGWRGWASDGETTLWEAKAGEGPLRCEEEA